MKPVVFLIVLLGVAFPLSAKVHIEWGTDIWEGFTQPDGNGFYQLLMSRIFTENEYDISIQFLPWQRVNRSLKYKDIDMTGAIQPTDDFYLSQQPVISSDIVAVYHADSRVADGPLESYVGAYRNGYDEDIFYRVVPSSGAGIPVDSPALAMELLQQGKIDYYVDLVSMVDAPLAQAGDPGLETRKIGQFHLYWAFAKNTKGRYLKNHFDTVFQSLRDSGELAKLYSRFGIALPAHVDDMSNTQTRQCCD
ncbi:substrate-binding periplasmic protein [Alteromonas sp. CYL-A6]|uniref:substrate-binding periplasmic protein n=1 Tax=Alteromonas nitratireducens TaxID=3390813 RepID=UPI0034B1E380